MIRTVADAGVRAVLLLLAAADSVSVDLHHRRHHPRSTKFRCGGAITGVRIAGVRVEDRGTGEDQPRRAPTSSCRIMFPNIDPPLPAAADSEAGHR